MARVQDVKTIAIIIGHDEREQGAVSANGTTEFQYNSALADLMQSYMMTSTSLTPIILYRPDEGYSELPAKVNTVNPDVAIELHCNAFDKRASGTETLFCMWSDNGRILAQLMQDAAIKALGLNDRGIKPIFKLDRGGHFLHCTRAPAVITEPFFIDNQADFKAGTENIDRLAVEYVRALEWYFS